MPPVKIFYSYAHEDEHLRDELSAYLGVLRQNNKIEEWHDRKIRPGINFNTEISDEIENTDVILFLISKDFLNSDYCFGIEVNKAFELQKTHSIEIIPILLKPCLFEESRFSQLQIIPRDAQPISTSVSKEDAWNAVAREIRDIVNIVSAKKTAIADSNSNEKENHQSSPFLNIAKQQITAYAELYERTRQQMLPGSERTVKMQDIFNKMKAIAGSTYSFLEEFTKSPLPGERLAAVSILHCFSDESYFDFLVDIVGAEKPFVGYQATLALRFAADSVTPKSYPPLLKAIHSAQQKLTSAEVGFDTDRNKQLRNAETMLNEYMQSGKI